MNFYRIFKRYIGYKLVGYNTNYIALSLVQDKLMLSRQYFELSPTQSVLAFYTEGISKPNNYARLRYHNLLIRMLYLIKLKTFSYGFMYIICFAFILFIDACLTDDEPV